MARFFPRHGANFVVDELLTLLYGWTLSTDPDQLDLSIIGKQNSSSACGACTCVATHPFQVDRLLIACLSNYRLIECWRILGGPARGWPIARPPALTYVKGTGAGRALSRRARVRCWPWKVQEECNLTAARAQRRERERERARCKNRRGFDRLDNLGPHGQDQGMQPLCKRTAVR